MKGDARLKKQFVLVVVLFLVFSQLQLGNLPVFATSNHGDDIVQLCDGTSLPLSDGYALGSF
jgi:hypothetical protein